MYDPKFEKGVRQKMEGLEFSPSASVWANIQKAVAGHRRRRGGFYFWRFTLPAALLAGLMSVAYFAGRPAGTSPATPATQLAATAAKTPGATPSATRPKGTSSIATASDEPTAATSGEASAIAAHPGAAAAARPHQTAARTGLTELPATSGPEPTQDRPVANQNTRSTIAGRSSTGTTDIFGASVASTTIAPYFYQPTLEGRHEAAVIKAARPSAKKGVISIGQLEKTKQPWEAGFTAGGGVSRLNRINLSYSAQTQSLSANIYNIATTTAAPSKTYVSDIRPDASFTGGIYLQKPLSRRWSVNIGMNLHYYSTRITIGQQVNTYVPATASLIVPTVSRAAQSSTAFIAGDRQVFTNHYYFLELPVNVQYQLNKSHLLPFFFEGGASLSRLMGSDALFYNTHSGVYYKDPGVLEKTQFNVASALMVGLPFHGIRILAGPQVQYGVTPLVNNNSQGDQHFLYAGLRVVVIPGRK
jgi:hypothetical protein